MELETKWRQGVVLQGTTLMVGEERGGGWSGVVQLNPRRNLEQDALQVVMVDGMVPGAAVIVKLVIAGNSGHTGAIARCWPSVVTSVNATPGERNALCAVTFRDPVTYLRSRPIWAAFSDCPVADLFGGALSVAAGGDGRPGRTPALPGLPSVRIREELRSDIAQLPYAMAIGESLGYWLNQIFGRLGIRMEMVGDAAGNLDIALCDQPPRRTRLNRDGGVTMYFDPATDPSATNLNESGVAVRGVAARPRGGLLDNLAGGVGTYVGVSGALGSVVTAARTGRNEAELRSGFRAANDRLGQVGASFTSSQPGLLPGRILNLREGSAAPPGDAGDAAAPPASPAPSRPDRRRRGSRGAAAAPAPSMPENLGETEQTGYASLLGARRWQVVGVSHTCVRARYWNVFTVEKIGLAWRPTPPPEGGAVLLSGMVDDGSSKAGALVRRDRLGRIPIRFPFAGGQTGAGTGAAAGGSTAGSSGSGTSTSGGSTRGTGDPAPAAPPGTTGGSAAGVAWPPTVFLSPTLPGAGTEHGFVADHRQGDWCKVSVLHPLYAEIVGFAHRDDRFLTERVRDATTGIVMREGDDEWRGILFRPDEDLPEEIESADSPEPPEMT